MSDPQLGSERGQGARRRGRGMGPSSLPPLKSSPEPQPESDSVTENTYYQQTYNTDWLPQNQDTASRKRMGFFDHGYYCATRTLPKNSRVARGLEAAPPEPTPIPNAPIPCPVPDVPVSRPMPKAPVTREPMSGFLVNPHIPASSQNSNDQFRGLPLRLPERAGVKTALQTALQFSHQQERRRRRRLWEQRREQQREQQCEMNLKPFVIANMDEEGWWERNKLAIPHSNLLDKKFTYEAGFSKKRIPDCIAAFAWLSFFVSKLMVPGGNKVNRDGVACLIHTAEDAANRKKTSKASIFSAIAEMGMMHKEDSAKFLEVFDKYGINERTADKVYATGTEKDKVNRDLQRKTAMRTLPPKQKAGRRKASGKNLLLKAEMKAQTEIAESEIPPAKKISQDPPDKRRLKIPGAKEEPKGGLVRKKVPRSSRSPMPPTGRRLAKRPKHDFELEP